MSPLYDPRYEVKTPLTSINRLRAPTPPSALGVSSPDEEQRWKAIKACIAKGDKAKRKAEDFYITAGQHLNALKAEHTGTWAEWEIKLKIRAGIGKSRASELMQIADGIRTLEQVRANTAERTRQARISPLRSGENAPAPEATAEAMKIEAVTDDRARKRPARHKDVIVYSAGKTLGEVHAEVVAAMTAAPPTADDDHLAEKLRAAEIKIAGLESEVEELKAENARLRAELEAKQETSTEKQGEA
jgi:hypothetical protein